MTLYLQPPPSDAPRLRPLVRLMINQACRALMEYLDRDAVGRPKRHQLLLSLDEFPTLGRLDFFTMNLRQMAGYGIKAVSYTHLDVYKRQVLLTLSTLITDRFSIRLDRFSVWLNTKRRRN